MLSQEELLEKQSKLDKIRVKFKISEVGSEFEAYKTLIEQLSHMWPDPHDEARFKQVLRRSKGKIPKLIEDLELLIEGLDTEDMAIVLPYILNHEDNALDNGSLFIPSQAAIDEHLVTFEKLKNYAKNFRQKWETLEKSNHFLELGISNKRSSIPDKKLHHYMRCIKRFWEKELKRKFNQSSSKYGVIQFSIEILDVLRLLPIHKRKYNALRTVVSELQ